MYELYPRLVEAVMGPALGPQLDEFKRLVGSVDSNFHGMSGAASTHMDKILGQAIGQQYRRPYRTPFCGDAAACREAVFTSIDVTVNVLEASQGADPNAWRAQAGRIRFVPGLLQRTIRFTNRPSGIQVLATFTGHRP